MMIADGVRPSSTDQGYILRRLLRRAVRYADTLGMGHGMLSELVPVVAEKYKGVYDNVFNQEALIVKEIWEEEDKFRKTLERGLKEIEKLSQKYEGNMNTFLLGADVLFDLYQTHGFPVEMSIEEVNQMRISNEGLRWTKVRARISLVYLTLSSRSTRTFRVQEQSRSLKVASPMVAKRPQHSTQRHISCSQGFASTWVTAYTKQVQILPRSVLVLTLPIHRK